MTDIISQLAKELKLKEEQVEKTVALIDEGCSIPFIARYRKEVTGSLDDAVLRDLQDRLTYLRNLNERREEVRGQIAAQEKLTPEIEEALNRASTLVELEDIYRPFRPKRKTRGSVAREKGLEELAKLIMEQKASYTPSIPEAAEAFVGEEKGVASAEEALAGAADIIAEDISDTADFRKMLRVLTFNNGVLTTAAAGEEDSVYANYYDYREPVRQLRQHRVLAINRGEKEEFLKVKLEVPQELAVSALANKIVQNPTSPAMEYLLPAIEDSYLRLLAPAVERDIRAEMTDEAGEGAIKIFADNLRHLLMGAPIKGKTVLGFDPGFRNGCKLAVVDKTGKVLTTSVVHLTEGKASAGRSAEILSSLIRRYKVDVVAIGNGTASRESERFVADVIHGMGDMDVKYTIVSESGASVYSASKLGTEEFPDMDVLGRGAVSIARRLQDPLAELVKIDPRAIGVGQYQHDMKQSRLTEALDGVVEDCVNAVGVDINTASWPLLSHISGINTTAARNIVTYREENGEFTNRAQLLKVPKIGAKAYQQSAGFLRVVDGAEILDNTGVHPESYEAAKSLLARFGYTDEDVRNGNIGELRKKATAYGVARLAEEIGCGEPTLLDIIGELEKPGRDIRDTTPPPCLRTDVMDISDLTEGMILTGTVRNVVDFGCFVDIGVHQDGLLHISEIADRRIAHPSDVLSVGDIIDVRVKSVDVQKKRIGLSRKGLK